MRFASNTSPSTKHQALSTLSSPLAIAVSGGADSMALLLLAHDWAKEHNGSVVALTVDHGLRPEAADEALQVRKWCEVYGIEHHTLKTQDSEFRIQKKTQDSYRTARYQLLTDWCKAHHIQHLLTAHHQDDQVETLFMRLSRGSFIDGLACMAPATTLRGICLVRPLLDTPKASLVAYLESYGQGWIEDPTNANPRYTRNCLRALLTDEDVKRRAAKVIGVFARARRIIDRKVEEALLTCVEHKDKKNILLLPPYRALPPEIAWRVCAQLIQTLTQSDHPPRTVKLLRLTHSIQSGTLAKPCTLGGLIFAPLKNGGELHIYKERML